MVFNPIFHTADIAAFQREPEFYAYGMLCALTIAAIWQILSSYCSLNTSSTHSISEWNLSNNTHHGYSTIGTYVVIN